MIGFLGPKCCSLNCFGHLQPRYLGTQTVRDQKGLVPEPIIFPTAAARLIDFWWPCIVGSATRRQLFYSHLLVRDV